MRSYQAARYPSWERGPERVFKKELFQEKTMKGDYISCKQVDNGWVIIRNEYASSPGKKSGTYAARSAEEAVDILTKLVKGGFDNEEESEETK